MIRVALIGAGIFARETYITNIMGSSSRVQLTAILSRSSESVDEALLLLPASEREKVLKFVGSEGEVEFFSKAKEVCDAVIVVVPIPLLGKYVERCLAAGVSVLSEKPVAMTSVEAKRLISLYREQYLPQSKLLGGGRPCQWHVAENYRLEPAVTYARDLVRQHSGSPKSFTLLCLRQQSANSKYAVTTWRAKPEYNGSFVLDGGIHFVALLRTILQGEVSDIHSIYSEASVVDCGACGVFKVGETVGSFNIRYGAFTSVLCRLDVYWEDAIMSIIQHKGVGYEVIMSGKETRNFGFEGLQEEFKLWLDTIDVRSIKSASDASGVSEGASSGGVEDSSLDVLSPEEGLKDLIIVEQMCNTKL